MWKTWMSHDGNHGLFVEENTITAPMLSLCITAVMRGHWECQGRYKAWGSGTVPWWFLHCWCRSFSIVQLEGYNYLPYDSTYLDSKFGGWLEGNVVVTPEGTVVDYIAGRQSERGRDMAAVVTISEDGQNHFRSGTGFYGLCGWKRKILHPV
jgi:hypothetical protein